MMRILIAFVMMVTASAHVGHDHGGQEITGAAERFDDFVKQNFFLKTLDPSPIMGDSYVLLADGEKYPLDSQFWSAAAHLADAMGEGLPVSEPEQKRLKIPFINGLLELRHKHFWLGLTVTGSEFFVRYGPLTLVMIVAAELIEHSLIPGPALCAFLQAGCVLWGKQVQEVYSSVRYRNPLGRSWASRVGNSFESTITRFQYWGALRLVFRDSPEKETLSKRQFKKFEYDPNEPGNQLLIDTPFWSALGREREAETCTHSHGFGAKCEAPSRFRAEAVTAPTADLLENPLRPDWSPSQRAFAAEEQLAFFELQMTLAKQATEHLAPQSFWLFWRLRMALAKEGAALDKYAFLLRKLASANLDPEATEKFRNLVLNFTEQYQDYLVSLSAYIQSINHGRIPFRTPLSDVIFKSPKRTFKELTRFLRGKCDDLLQRVS